MKRNKFGHIDFGSEVPTSMGVEQITALVGEDVNDLTKKIDIHQLSASGSNEINLEMEWVKDSPSVI